MMSISTNFFKNLYKKDIIFYYTKASTAIYYILFNNQLRFNQARKSFDPIESKQADRRTIYYGEEVSNTQSISQQQEANDLHNYVEDLEEQFHQICFCQNYIDPVYDEYISNFEGHEEMFGFTKLRMWDQYADRFAGVCIVFSKEKILSLNNQNIKLVNLIEGNVKYLTFQELWCGKVGNIQGNYLKNVGKEKYEKQLEEQVKESFLYKHIDYSGENEYRIGALFDAQKRSVEKLRGELVFNRAMMLDISNCVEAIFISSFANDNQKSDLLRYAKKMNVPIIEIIWQNDSFKLRDFKDWTELLENISVV